MEVAWKMLHDQQNRLIQWTMPAILKGLHIDEYLGSIMGVILLLKLLAVGEAPGVQEVKQSPQLLHAVLEWGPCDEQLVLELPGEELLVQRALCILQPALHMGL